MSKPTHAVDRTTKAVSSENGLIVKPIPIDREKSTCNQACEFAAVIQWTAGCLFLGLSCLVIFIYLVCIIGKQVFLMIVTVSLPPLVRSPAEVSQWSPWETVYFFLTVASLACYICHWQLDMGAEERGSHLLERFRYLSAWKRLANYFPIQLVVSEELLQWNKVTGVGGTSTDGCEPCNFGSLPANRNYLVGYHPHGVFSTGAFVNFVTEATGFSKAFPGLTPRLAILKILFKIPLFRDLLLALGMVAASKRSLHYLLDEKKCKRTGNFVIVVVGGLSESLEAKPNNYRMVIAKRYGFFKLALQTGATLIPCLSFGEQNMYNMIHNEPGSRLRRFQEWLERVSTFTLPLFYGYGLFPYRTPVNTVVGAPIPCEKIADPTNKQVEEVKRIYMDNLQKLFWRYKSAYDPDAEAITFT